jgi:hypothetical protein
MNVDEFDSDLSGVIPKLFDTRVREVTTPTKHFWEDGFGKGPASARPLGSTDTGALAAEGIDYVIGEASAA